MSAAQQSNQEGACLVDYSSMPRLLYMGPAGARLDPRVQPAFLAQDLSSRPLLHHFDAQLRTHHSDHAYAVYAQPALACL